MEINYEDALANALESHPALMSSQFNVRAAKAGINMALSQFSPTVSAFYQYSWRHQDFDRVKDIFDKDYNWYLGVSISVPLFQGFSRLAQTGKAKLDYRSSMEAMAQIKRDIALEAKQAYFEVQHAKRKIAVTNDAVEAAEEDLRLNKEKYSLGAGTMLDLINAQVSLSTVKSDQIQALYDYKYAIARLQKAMGKLEK
jgi:outer membrane protein